MNYPNPGDPNQPNQYPPSQGQPGTPYGGGGYQQPPSGYGEQQSYQQGAYQQPPYQQSPYQQQSPYYAPSAVAFDWRYITAGVGALLSLIAFFLPYYSFGGATYYGVTSPSYGVSGLQIGHQVLLDIIIALAAIVIALLLQFGHQIFKAPASPNMQRLANSLNANQRSWGLALLVIGAFGVFFRFILDLSVLNIWGIGSWLFVIGMIAVAVGGFFVWRPPASMAGQVPPTR
jgi:hypothetical protein